MQFVNIKCDLCGMDDNRLLATVTVEDESFSLVQCNTCRLAYINPQPAPSDLTAFYASKYGEELETAFWDDYLASSENLYRQVYEIVHRLSSEANKLLDYGCGIGGFLQFMFERGFDVLGIDYSSRAVSHVKETLGLQAEWGATASYLPAESFDVITLLDVLEHISEPCLTLSGLYRALKPGGVMVVRVPNFNFGRLQIFAGKLGVNSMGYSIQLSPPEHLYYFAPDTLRAALDKAGFRRISVIPARDINFGSDKIRSGLKWIYASQARLLYLLSFHKFVLSPAILGYAVK